MHGIGSGYLIADGWVLTAGHVIEGATEVRAWVDPPATLTSETEARVDVARIVRVPEVEVGGQADWVLVPLHGHLAPRGLVPAVFARFDRDTTEPVPVVAIGLPWYRLHQPDNSRGAGQKVDSTLLREPVQVTGRINPASGGKSGVLTLNLDAAPDGASQLLLGAPTSTNTDAAPFSVWNGMSGAAVWSGRLLVGVVVAHELLEGPAALSVGPAPDNPNPAALNLVPGIGSPKFLLSTAGEVAHLSRGIAQDLAPAWLSERDGDIAELDNFAAGGQQWLWLEAEAFAGKTALTAWWVANPKPDDRRTDVDPTVVSCFLRRTSRDDTADHVIRTWAKQLAALAKSRDLGQIDQLTASLLGRQRLKVLIEEAAQFHQRLLLVVDGLDEYNQSELVQVKDWLPDNLPANVGLLVTSRRGAEHGIPHGHPLERHIHRLAPSTAAGQIRKEAEREIDHAVRDPAASMDRQILGFLAAAGGPLTIGDLRVLINWTSGQVDHFDIEAVWRRRLHRTVTQGPAGSGLAFSHGTLLTSAHDKLADDLPERRDVIHAWADLYASRNWPDDTPAYLLRSYGRMLADHSSTDPTQASRFIELAIDTARHRRLRTTTGGDADALEELNAAKRVLTTDPKQLRNGKKLKSLQRAPCSHPDPDLDALALVVWHRDRLGARNRHTPVLLPSVWAQLGQPARAENLARAIPGQSSRARSLAQVAIALSQDEASLCPASRVARDAYQSALEALEEWWPNGGDAALAAAAEALAQTGQFDDAERAANLISKPADRARALAMLVRLLVSAARPEDAKRIAEQIDGRPIAKSSMGHLEPGVTLTEIAETLALAGQLRDAQRIIGAIHYDWDRVTAIRNVVAALTRAGRVGAAEELATHVHSLRDRALTLVSLAETLGQIGEFDDAVRVAELAEHVAIGVGEPDEQAYALVRIAEALKALAQPEQSERVTLGAQRVSARIIATAARVEALSRVAFLLKAVGRLEQALGVVDEAKRAAVGIVEPAEQASAFVWVANALFVVGRGNEAISVAEEAERIAGRIDDEKDRATARMDLVEMLARAGRYAMGERITRLMDDTWHRAWAQRVLVAVLAGVGRYTWAERIAATIQDSFHGAAALENLMEVMALAGQVGDVDRVAAKHAVAWRTSALSSTVDRLAEAGKFEAAEDLAARIGEERGRERAMLKLAVTLAAAGRSVDAERVLAARVSTKERAEAYAVVAHHLVAIGQPGGALRVAEEAERATAETIGPMSGSLERSFLARALARAGCMQDALQILGGHEDNRIRFDDWSHGSLERIATVLAQAGQFAYAAQAIGGIGEDERDVSLSRIAEALAGLGLFAEAEWALAGIDEDSIAAEASVAVADALAKSGRVAEAEWAAADPGAVQRYNLKMRRVDRYIVRWHSREACQVEALAKVAERLIHAGRLEEAARIAEKAEQVVNVQLEDAGHLFWPTDLVEKAGFLTRIAELLVGAGRLRDADRVVQLAVQAAGPSQYFEGVLTSAVRILARLEQWEDAERVAAQITTDWFRPTALVPIVASYAQAERWEEADRIMAEIRAADPHALTSASAEALASIAAALGLAGRWEDARRVALDAGRLARTTSHLYKVPTLFASVLDTLARSGQFALAERVLDEMDGFDVNNVLIRFVDSLVGLGRFSEAQRIADRIKDAATRADRLARIAEGLAEAGHLAEAARFIAAAWSIGTWTTPLMSLSKVRGSALLVLKNAELRT